MSSQVPENRISILHEAPPNPQGEFVLYWMTSNRRPSWNFSLQQALHDAQSLNQPLLVIETSSCDQPWNSRRALNFLLQGMQNNSLEFKARNVAYYPCITQTQSDLNQLIHSLAQHASLLITDLFPLHKFPPALLDSLSLLPLQVKQIDSNGIFPLKALPKVFSRAFDFRRYLQKNILPFLEQFPTADPFKNVSLTKPAIIPPPIRQNWPPANLQTNQQSKFLDSLTVDQSVRELDHLTGGFKQADHLLQQFKTKILPLYDQDRNQPEKQATSRFSPYLHFGHLSTHQIFHELTTHEQWTPFKLSPASKGSSTGWWGSSPALESFLDELITWREIGYNFCFYRDDYDQYTSLPDWALKTLNEHAQDPREHLYSTEQFESADTHDPLWNAAQNQLVREGIIHNYLRMLWGKKILEWSDSPQSALQTMIQLNNKYALDGCNPNSYSGIFWVLGRYDRAWGPERPIFGKIRYMSSDNTARKVKVKQYIKRYA